jgi:hypothetical protein
MINHSIKMITACGTILFALSIAPVRADSPTPSALQQAKDTQKSGRTMDGSVSGHGGSTLDTQTHKASSGTVPSVAVSSGTTGSGSSAGGSGSSGGTGRSGSGSGGHSGTNASGLTPSTGAPRHNSIDHIYVPPPPHVDKPATPKTQKTAAPTGSVPTGGR